MTSVPSDIPDTTLDAPRAPTPKAKIVHPLWVRLCHWINAFAILIMVMSGWRIYDASPIWPFKFGNEISLGNWLGGAIMWHFAAMWLLVINGLIYVTLGIVTGRFEKKFLPIRVKDVIHDVRAALTFKLSHEDLSVYNSIQKILYSGVLVLGVIIVLSGLSIWKSVQFQELTALFGGHEIARIVHFVCMAGIVAFVVIHVAVALLVPKSIKAMILGR
ncbi:MAG: cytochrome b/b6 domain-containing protein [Alphaproteobacteria bacterium]